MGMFKTTLLLAGLTGILMFMGKAVGGNGGMMLMFLISMGMNFFSYWYSDKIVLKMYGAQPVTMQDAPGLVHSVSKLAQAAQMPMPKVYIINEAAPNAFATGRDPEHGVVAVTTGIMQALSTEELEGVLAHELAHIKNRDTLISTIVAGIAGTITMIANIAQWGAIMGGFGRSDDDEEGAGGLVGSLFMIILAPLAATIIQLAISRTREYGADAKGAEFCGNPLALAEALRKIEYYAQHRTLPEASPSTAHMFIINPFAGGGQWFMSLFSTHPATGDRIAKLEQLARGR